MATILESDLLYQGQTSQYGVTTTSNGQTTANFGLNTGYGNLDVKEYTKMLNSYSGNSNVDYWDTVGHSDVEGLIDDGEYPDYDMAEDGDVIQLTFPSGYTRD